MISEKYLANLCVRPDEAARLAALCEQQTAAYRACGDFDARKVKDLQESHGAVRQGCLVL